MTQHSPVLWLIGTVRTLDLALCHAPVDWRSTGSVWRMRALARALAAFVSMHGLQGSEAHHTLGFLYQETRPPTKNEPEHPP